MSERKYISPESTRQFPMILYIKICRYLKRLVDCDRSFFVYSKDNFYIERIGGVHMPNDSIFEKSIEYRRAEIEILPFYRMKIITLEQDITKLENRQFDVDEMRQRAKWIEDTPDFVIAVADSEYLREMLLNRYRKELSEWESWLKRFQEND